MSKPATTKRKILSIFLAGVFKGCLYVQLLRRPARSSLLPAARKYCLRFWDFHILRVMFCKTTSREVIVILTVFLCLLQHFLGPLASSNENVFTILFDTSSGFRYFYPTAVFLLLLIISAQLLRPLPSFLVVLRLCPYLDPRRWYGPCFASAMSTFSAIKHERTPSQLLASSPRKLYIVLWNRFSSLTGILVSTLHWTLHSTLQNASRITQGCDNALYILIPVIRVPCLICVQIYLAFACFSLFV